MGELCCYGWGNYEGTPVMGGEVVSFGYPFIMLLWVGKKETPSLCCIGGGVPLIWDSLCCKGKLAFPYGIAVLL